MGRKILAGSCALALMAVLGLADALVSYADPPADVCARAGRNDGYRDGLDLCPNCRFNPPADWDSYCRDVYTTNYWRAYKRGVTARNDSVDYQYSYVYPRRYYSYWGYRWGWPYRPYFRRSYPRVYGRGPYHHRPRAWVSPPRYRSSPARPAVRAYTPARRWNPSVRHGYRPAGPAVRGRRR